MTICVSVRVGEGLVLAAGSMVTLEGTMGTQQGVLQTFEYASKLTRKGFNHTEGTRRGNDATEAESSRRK